MSKGNGMNIKIKVTITRTVKFPDENRKNILNNHIGPK